VNRRRFLMATTAGIAGLAGCSTAPSPTDAETDTSATPGTTDGTDPDAGAGTAPDAGAETAPEPTAGTDRATPGTPPAAVGLDTLVDGLSAPVDVVFVPNGDRRYVAEQGGLVRVHESGGLRPEPLVDLRDAVETGFEKGLLGLALHPAFPDDRRLFVRYSAPPRPGTPDDYSHTFVLASVRVGEDGRTVRAGSERSVLEIPEPQPNHNAGSIVFGPDDLLYVGVGDGGGSGDEGRGHADDWYDRLEGGNGQDVTQNRLGSVLRIDVDGREDDREYAIPGDNPLVGRDGPAEQYAWGFRNPWRLAFDGADLYAGDVGENRYEEIDLVERGGNYGWNVTEGSHCYVAASCPDRVRGGDRDGEPLRPPVVEYPHSGAAVSGISVIAGNVYRGEALPGLRGWLVFGDYRADGRLFVAEPVDEDGERWPTRVLPVAGDDADSLAQIFSFRRHRGELYVLGAGDAGGGLYRIVPAG